MRKISMLFLSTCVLLTASSTVLAGQKNAIAGTLACGGNQLIRNGGTEFHQSNYVFRNFNEVESIQIDSIRIYNALGVLVADYPGSALPNFTNSVLGPLDSLLDAHQTAQLNSPTIFGNSSFAKKERPLQVIIEWSASTPVKPLKVGHVRLVRDRSVSIDALGNQIVKIGAERSRHSSKCRTINLER